MNNDFLTSCPFSLFHRDCPSVPSDLMISVPNKAGLEDQLSCVIYSLAVFDGCWFGQKEHFESIHIKNFIIIW